MEEQAHRKLWEIPEFILVAIMLIVLFFLVVAVLHMSVVPVATNQSLNATQVTQILDFRKIYWLL